MVGCLFGGIWYGGIYVQMLFSQVQPGSPLFFCFLPLRLVIVTVFRLAGSLGMIIVV